PSPEMFQIISHVFRQQDVPRIAAIHDSLGHVDSGAGDVGAATDIDYFADRPAVNTHPYQNLRVRFEFLPDFERAPRWFLRTIAKDQRHSIASRETNEFFVRRL